MRVQARLPDRARSSALKTLDLAARSGNPSSNRRPLGECRLKKILTNAYSPSISNLILCLGQRYSRLRPSGAPERTQRLWALRVDRLGPPLELAQRPLCMLPKVSADSFIRPFTALREGDNHIDVGCPQRTFEVKVSAAAWLPVRRLLAQHPGHVGLFALDAFSEIGNCLGRANQRKHSD
jgi:hypothetical protein